MQISLIEASIWAKFQADICRRKLATNLIKPYANVEYLNFQSTPYFEQKYSKSQKSRIYEIFEMIFSIIRKLY